MSVSKLIRGIFGSNEATLTIQPGKKIASHHRKVIANIRSIVGLQQNYWNYFYLQTIYNLAEYVQLLPASEAHHHSGRGGLLSHTLDTALHSLRTRRGKLLPPNADAETVTKLKDVWTYGIFTGALCHDIGKPITDVTIEVFDKNENSLGFWQPFSSSMFAMVKSRQAKTYRIEYKRKRIYASHERASALYVHHIVPNEGMQWLVSNQELFFYWTNLLTGHGEDTGLLGSIIHEADRLSVASNLAGDQINPQEAIAITNRKPLHQRIVTSLRNQIDKGNLPMNRDGAAGWVVDDQLWVVVKRALDQIRDHMQQEGQSGIPARNDRMMDELQQYGILLPNGDRAVWKCRVFDQGWPKAHELTLLCFPVSKIWASADAVPDTFAGTVVPIDQSPVPSTGPDPEVQSSPVSIDNQTHNAEPEKTASKNNTTERPTIDFSALASSLQSSADTPAAPQPTDKTSNSESSPDGNAGEKFLNWLRDGLHERKFKVNDAYSKIHRTAEGIFLVSPSVFKEFDQANWSYVQKRFTKLRLHERNTNGTNIHEYLVTGKKKKSLIKGFLIQDTANVFPGIELPTTNYALSRVEK